MRAHCIKNKNFYIPDGTLELIKWLALALMTGDHINKYLFNETLPYLFEAGRVAMPLFVFILAYNLSRPQISSDAFHRTSKRLFVFGIIATVPFIKLGSLYLGYYPLNILFCLLAVTLSIKHIKKLEEGSDTTRNLLLAFIIFIVGGSLVEFWWPAVTLGIAFWWFCRGPGLVRLIPVVGSLLLLSPINGNLWAFAALPTFLLLSRIKLKVPRLKWLFYVYYPLHLTVLLLIRIPMTKAGYLFF
ncbi:TraX protein [Pseudomonas duriflava]|uniref:TraX protein n=1 Tax=Pseudomonas duriflava TaxID=459528 RepID=A0A562PNZ1_9PSED|nr:TraX family protein [Pseudomonas duriflava]TWI46172.1 TraX protein [Pseudomonas duriflava]